MNNFANNLKKIFSLTTLYVFLAAQMITLCPRPAFAQQGNSVPQPTRAGGRFYAASYGRYQLHTFTNTLVGATSFTLDIGSPTANGASDSGRTLNLFAGPVFPILQFQDAAETSPGLTVTSASNCGFGASNSVGSLGACTIGTAAAGQAHGANALVTSGTFGAQEAVNDAFQSGGGTVVIDANWTALGGTDATLVALVPFPNVIVEDDRSGVPIFWHPTPNATFLASPTTLTATTVGFGLNGANTTGGTYNGASTYHYGVACVDLLGNEGPISADFSAATAGTGTANQIGFAAPAAAAGCVGYVPYISLAAGSFALEYRVPLATYTNGVPTANGVCTLTKIETITAACAIANTTYSQTGSNAIVSALTVNTARIPAQLGAASTTADIVSNPSAHTVYTYAPGGTVPSAINGSYPAFTVTTAAASTVPAILGSIFLKANFMNFVGRTLRICGHATQASNGSTATIQTIQFIWNADGSNTTGAGVIIGSGITNNETLVTANADSYNFCGTIRTTVSGTGVTAGSIQDLTGFLCVVGAVAAPTSSTCGSDTTVGATASLNLANEARIDVQYVHTTGTDANGLVLQNLTVEVLN